MALAVGIVLSGATNAAASHPRSVAGDGSPDRPFVVAQSGDITSFIQSGQSVQLSGGVYTIAIPASGTGITLAGNGAGIVAGDGNVAASTPVITYAGVISGTGQVNVTNTTSTAQPALYGLISGGALVVAGAQTFTNPSGPVFSVAGNTVLSINGGSIPAGQALYNDGEIWANKDGYVFTDILGGGYISLENNDANEAQLSGVDAINGSAINLFGEYVSAGTVLPERLAIVSTDINVFKNGGGGGNGFFATYNPAADTIAGGNYFANGPDTQLQGPGVTQFDGASFVIVRNPLVAGYTGIYPPAEAEKYDYFYDISYKKGRVFYITHGTMLLGDGRAVVNHDDCSLVVGACVNTNNTFAQGNPYGQNFVIETGQFNYTPITTLAEAETQSVETLALDYSGVYRFNGGVNFVYGNVDARAYGGVNVTDNSGNMGPNKGTGSATIVNGENYGNLVVVNPGANKPANHVIVTQPIYQQGITLVQPNTVLQLGDGTAGTPYGTKGTATTNGVTGVYNFCSSGGNGMLVTLGNAAPVYQNAAFYQIQDNGTLIVDNVANARDVVDASVVANSFMSANELDGITGTGSVEQRGGMPLTLGSASGNPDSYTGGTLIDAGATLVVGSPGALGASSGPASGVVNNGILMAAPGMHAIDIPGDYSQGAGPMVGRPPPPGPMSLSVRTSATNVGVKSATLVIQVGGTSPGTDADLVQVAGHATLRGALALHFVNGFKPASGQSFTILTAGNGVGGAFSTVTADGVPVSLGTGNGAVTVTID